MIAEVARIAIVGSSFLQRVFRIPALSFVVLVSLAATSVAKGIGYRPVVYPVPAMPAEVGRLFWANPSLAGTSNGVLAWDGVRWIRTFADREVLALGEMPSGWWASGSGYLGLSDGRLIVESDEFSGGTFFNDSIFLLGAKGVWRFHNDRLLLIRAYSGAKQTRIFCLGDSLYLFVGGTFEVWKDSSFEPAKDWAGFVSQDVSKVRRFGIGYHLLATEGLFYKEGNSIAAAFSEGFGNWYSRATVDFFVDSSEAVLATYYEGVRSISWDGRLRWELGISDLGGNPYSLVRSPLGFRVGTSAGGVDVYSDLLHRLPLAGEDILTISSNRAYLPSGAIDLLTGTEIETPFLAENEGVSATWGRVVLPSGRTVVTGGREFLAVGRVGDCFFGVQASGLHILTAEGTASEFPVAGANSAVVHDGAIWIGSAGGVLRYANGKLIEIHTGGVYFVADGVTGPVFIFDQKVMPAEGSPVTLPGKVLAVDHEFAAVRVGSSIYVGRYTEGWRPLDLPDLPPTVTRLKRSGDFLYVLSRREILRVYLPRTQELTLNVGVERSAEINGGEYVETLPAKRSFPWLSPTYVAYLDGEGVSIGEGEIRLRGIEFGQTRLELVASLAGLQSTTSVVIVRPRPWWLSWPGALVLVGTLGATTWLFTRWRTRRLQKKADELQHLVEERTKALDDALKAREFFFSAVSHEIRNPLNGVVGLCEIINDSIQDLEPKKRRALMRMLAECIAQLRSTVDDVLDFSRIDRGQLDLHESDFEVRTLVEGSTHAVDPGARHTALVLPPTEVWLRGDAGKIRHIVTNFVSNALKYSNPKGAVVKLDITPNSDSSFAVYVGVSNQGETIDPEELKRILAGHGRGKVARQSSVSGSGLGLAVALRMASRLGGKIEARSVGGQTEFGLRLNLPVGAQLIERAGIPVGGIHKRVLVVEDEQYNRWVLGHYLSKLGASCDWACDGASALKAIRAGKYDLVITDIVLPDMDGTSVIIAIREEFGPLAPKFIAITAFTTPERITAIKQNGVDVVLTKPVDFERLAGALGVKFSIEASSLIDAPKRDEILRSIERDWLEIQKNLSPSSQFIRSAHALRSKAAFLEAPDLSTALSRLEIAASDGNHEGVSQAARDVEQGLMKAREGIKS